MVHTAYKVNTSRNAYGDYVSDSTTTATPCHFRYITKEISGATDEVVSSTAMVWFMPDENVDKGDVIKVDDEYFKIESIIKARRLRNPAVLFLKCSLVKYGFIS